jgi:hypothetical protein
MAANYYYYFFKNWSHLGVIHFILLLPFPKKDSKESWRDNCGVMFLSAKLERRWDGVSLG